MPRRPSPRETRRRESFNRGWRFQRGEPKGAGRALSYARLRPWILATGTELIVEGPVPERPKKPPKVKHPYLEPGFDDSAWRSVELPHDWGIEGPFRQELPGETGKLPWQGVGWYRKRFKVKAGDRTKSVLLEIDGAMAFSTVWLNGHLVGGWPYGYTSFCLDLTPWLRFGDDNVLAVRLDNPPDSSRWYPGSGLYRNVWLQTVPRLRFCHWGIFVSTPLVEPRRAVVEVDVTLENRTSKPQQPSIEVEVHRLGEDGAPLGPVLARATTAGHEPAAIDVLPDTYARRTLSVTLTRPKLWSLSKRHRYLATTRLVLGGRVVDEQQTRFGIRKIRVAPELGFLLNDEVVKLNGVCLHHDMGALGSAVHERALERQLEILQEMGCNAIRTSHNPPAPELLELCDRMGMLVMDEAFDCWRRGKKWPAEVSDPKETSVFYDYARVYDDWHERDLRAMLRRDRNHPSVVMWSIGNEVMEQWQGDGWPLATHLAGIVREEDRTRPITSAFNGETSAYNGFQTALDVLGFNYKPEAYARLNAYNPALPLLGAETASAISTRGAYFFPVSDDKLEGRENFQVSSYDLSAARWAQRPDEEFRAQDGCPYVMGEFVWTGFDYLGEPTPYNSDSTNLLNFSDEEQRARAARELAELGRISVPSRSSYFGIIDLAGFPKDRFYLYQARWRPDLKRAHILPHWTWPEREGKLTPVHVYSSADEAELFLNGQSLGRRKKRRFEYRFRWDDVVYEPGKLEVVTYKNKRRWASAERRTAGPAARIVLRPDRASLTSDGKDLCYVRVEIVDAHGELVPRARHQLSFRLSGPARIAAVDNGDPTSFEPFQATERRAFNGLALVIVRTVRGRGGSITLSASADGLSGSRVRLTSRA